MAIRKKCIYCGEPVSTNGYCTSCRLNQRFMEKAMNTSAWHYNLGLEKARARDLSGAVDSLKQSLRYNKMNIRSRNLLGLIYYEMGETVPALSQWVISMNYQPEKNPAVRYLKELKDDPRELERASEAAREFNRALEHAKQHSFDLAVISLRKALTLERNDIKAHLLMALIYIQQNRKGMAKKHLSRVLSIDRTNVEAQRILREIGEKEESIVRLAEQGDEAADELFSYYGVETPEGQRPARKIEPVETGDKRRSTRMSRFKEASRARFSNVYMISGIIIGMLILLLVFLPGIKRNAEGEVEAQENSYLKELSARNAEIASLTLSVDEAKKKTEKAEREKASLEKDIQSLKAEVKELEAQIASGGAAILPDKTEASTDESTETTEQATENPEASAETDEEDGITPSEIQAIIAQE